MSARLHEKLATLAGQGRRALVPFITAGDPGVEMTVPVMHALVEAGADLLELGVPFSDPMADGPVIQASSERAISRGVSLADVFSMVREFRKQDSHTPVVLMGYMNPVEHLGYQATARQAAECGVDGLLLVDCPPEEGAELQAALDEQGLVCIYLVAPTTTDQRLARIAAVAGGYLYYVALKGVTGAATDPLVGLEAQVARIREASPLPLMAGFGIKDGATAARMAAHTDGVIIGSALVEALQSAQSINEAERIAQQFLSPVRQAIDQV